MFRGNVCVAPRIPELLSSVIAERIATEDVVPGFLTLANPAAFVAYFLFKVRIIFYVFLDHAVFMNL